MVALFVVLTFVLFILADILVLKARKKNHPAFEGASPVFNKKSFKEHGNIFVSPGHTWVTLGNSGPAKIGVDDFVLKALGKLSLTSFIKMGTEIKSGDIIFEGTSGSHKYNFRSPVNGTINGINTDLLQKNLTDPYSNWAVQINPVNPEQNKKDLKTGNELSAWINEEFNRLKEFIHINTVKPEMVGVTMLDGGNIVEGAVAYVNNEGQANFEKEFLTF